MWDTLYILPTSEKESPKITMELKGMLKSSWVYVGRLHCCAYDVNVDDISMAADRKLDLILFIV